MQELRDKQLDADIARSLRFDTLVPPLRQQVAKELLLQRAAEQTMLPPLAAATVHSGLRDHAHTLSQNTLRLLSLLIVNSSIYERARRPPRFYQHYNAHGRYALSIIHVLA